MDDGLVHDMVNTFKALERLGTAPTFYVHIGAREYDELKKRAKVFGLNEFYIQGVGGGYGLGLNKGDRYSFRIFRRAM